MEPVARGLERVVLPEAALPHPDETRTTKISQVPGDGGLRSPEHRDQVPHADLAVVLEEVEDTQAGAIREGAEHPIHGGGGHGWIVVPQNGEATKVASISRPFSAALRQNVTA